MSGASGSGGQQPVGLVQNSVLSFVASAQAIQPTEDAGNLKETSDSQSQADRVPPGLKALCEACSKMYPDQPNPLQVTTRLKYWLGGEDPLDYISMYWNPGRPEEHIPPHWHYISFGLSDLHGDGRVHPAPCEGSESGYGFELTFRLESAEPRPPLWPAQLCQALARYVFTTGNKLCAGDHISWHRPLCGSQSRLRHLLVAADAAHTHIHTPHGTVQFLQIVGCTARELKAAQRGSGFEVLRLIGEDSSCGGSWLVSRTSRRRSARGVRLRGAGGGGGEGEGRPRAQLAGVNAKLSWAPTQGVSHPSSPSALTSGLEQQIKDTLQRGLTAMSAESIKLDEPGKMSTDSFEMSSIERALPQIPDTLADSWSSEDKVQYFEGVHIVMNPEGASLLPLAIDGRVVQGAHFTWRCGAAAVTVMSSRVRGASASQRRPYAARDCWLQVVISDSETEELSALVAPLAKLSTSDSETDSDSEENSEPPSLPLSISCRGLTVTVLPESYFL